MPTNLARGCPKLVVLDLLGTVLEHDHAFQSALAASFQAHGERVDQDTASLALGHPGPMGIRRVLKWLYPREEPNEQSVASIHDLTQKALMRLVKHAANMVAAPGVERLCTAWRQAGIQVVAASVLDEPVTTALTHRLGWQTDSPFSALVVASRLPQAWSSPGMIAECMRRVGMDDASQVAVVSPYLVSLVGARKLGCGWIVLKDDGALTMEQTMALAPSAIVEQASDLGALWRLPSGKDVALDDEIAAFLNKESV